LYSSNWTSYIFIRPYNTFHVSSHVQFIFIWQVETNEVILFLETEEEELRWWRTLLLLDEVMRKFFRKNFGARCQCCDTSHPHGFTYTDRERGIMRQEARETRDETQRIVFRGSHGSGSTWIIPVPVRPTRTCPWNSRSRTRLDAHPSGLDVRLDYGRTLGGISSDEFSRFFSSANATRTTVLSVC